MSGDTVSIDPDAVQESGEELQAIARRVGDREGEPTAPSAVDDALTTSLGSLYENERRASETMSTNTDHLADRALAAVERVRNADRPSGGGGGGGGGAPVAV